MLTDQLFTVFCIFASPHLTLQTKIIDTPLTLFQDIITKIEKRGILHSGQRDTSCNKRTISLKKGPLVEVRHCTPSNMNKICRASIFYEVPRLIVPDHKVLWNVPFPEYDPPIYNMEGLCQKPWADPEIGSEGFNPKWNSYDETHGLKIDRQSYVGKQSRPYKVLNGHPVNPQGRTGLCGRGTLGRWGPNHAADAIVSRWKRAQNGSIIKDPISEAPVFQFISILRGDCEEWAIPGGFVDPNEVVAEAVLREFHEEALNSGQLNCEEQKEMKSMMNIFFSKGVQVYRGYVDDPRNTDNAWIETLAMNFHDESGKLVEKLFLKAGDDAADVKWLDFHPTLKLYASHFEIVEKAAKLLRAYC